MSRAVAGGFLTTPPPGKPEGEILIGEAGVFLAQLFVMTNSMLGNVILGSLSSFKT